MEISQWIPAVGCRLVSTVRHAVVALLLLVISGCISVPLSYYDGTTYANLTNLKAETMTLVERFDTTPPADNQAAIDQARLSLRKALEYEKGKGTSNSDTADQLALIMTLFDEDVAAYQQSAAGELGPRYFNQAAAVLGQAFDQAIATENQKNQNSL